MMERRRRESRRFQSVGNTRRSRASRHSLAAALAVGLALSLSACGGDDESASPTTAAGSNQPVKVKVGTLPISPLAPLYAGAKEGIFEKHGLALEPKVHQGGAALIPSVISGELQFGYSSVASIIAAVAKGLELQIIAPDGGNPDSGVVVKKGSDITGVRDLAGKTIAVNTVGSVGDVTISAALKDAGVDPSSVKFIELQFPEMLPALAAGRVDAVWEVEPFLSQAKRDGLPVVLSPFEQLGADRPTISAYFATKQYVEDNPDVAKGFAAAMRETFEWGNDNDDAVRAVVPEFTEIPVEAAKVIPMGGPYETDVNSDSVRRIAELMLEYGHINEVPDIDALLATP